MLRIKVREIFADPEIPQVVFTTGTHSTDARLFEVGTPETTARSGWGRKLKTKMRRRQAGVPAPDLLRVLVVNFAEADTGWPDFFAWPEIATRLGDTIRVISGELTSVLPYDLVLPARLDIDCGFGVPVWLDASTKARGDDFLDAAGMKGQPPRARTEANADELAKLFEEEPTRAKE